MVNPALEMVKLVVTWQVSAWESQVVREKLLYSQFTPSTCIMNLGWFAVRCVPWWVLVMKVSSVMLDVRNAIHLNTLHWLWVGNKDFRSYMVFLNCSTSFCIKKKAFIIISPFPIVMIDFSQFFLLSLLLFSNLRFLEGKVLPTTDLNNCDSTYFYSVIFVF